MILNYHFEIYAITVLMVAFLIFCLLLPHSILSCWLGTSNCVLSIVKYLISLCISSHCNLISCLDPRKQTPIFFSSIFHRTIFKWIQKEPLFRRQTDPLFPTLIIHLILFYRPFSQLSTLPNIKTNLISTLFWHEFPLFLSTISYIISYNRTQSAFFINNYQNAIRVG